MDRNRELLLAKAPYNWLKASPLLTIPTMMIIGTSIGTSIGTYIWGIFPFLEYIAYGIAYGIGALAGALWHLLLLQYARNKESAFVREHGRKALLQAGIRTGVALFGVLLDGVTGSGGALLCAASGILLLIWIINATQSKGWVERSAPALAAPTEPKEAYLPALQPSQDMLDAAFADLDSEDDGVVLQAIDKVSNFSEVNQAILQRLEQLADEDDNIQIRMEARSAFNRLRAVKSFSNDAIGMNTGDNMNAQDILNQILSDLQNADEEIVRKAVETARRLDFSSQAVRAQIESLAIHSPNHEIRAAALAALNTPANRAVQRQVNPNKLDRGIRYTILLEINEWVKSRLIDTHVADTLRRRYDFDFAPQTPPQAAPAPKVESAPQAVPSQPLPAETPTPVTPAQPQVQPEPSPSLLQTLTSEAAIRVYLYLGAFFVIAAAAILGVVVPWLRIPILILGTLTFGGLAVLVKRRLPQPSFALFIVFSFLLLITANNLGDMFLFNASEQVRALYWTFVFFALAAVWSGSAWLYESRLFSITAFGALLLAFLRIGDLFDAQLEFDTSMAGIAAIVGLGGVWLIKKWKDGNFALPLFLTVQTAQGMALLISLFAFGIEAINPQYAPLWHLSGFFTLGLAFVFFILSNALYPFFAFPWLAAGTLMPMPWFVSAAFEFGALGWTVVLSVWGMLMAGTSEILHRVEALRKYSLPVLVASIPTLWAGVITGFAHDAWLSMIVSFAAALAFTVLHTLRTRWWVWSLALLYFIAGYFNVLELDFVQKVHVFFGYPVLGISLLFLFPDLLLKKDWRANAAWRLPPRIAGALFSAYNLLFLLGSLNPTGAAICYGVYAFFFAVYALAYSQPLLGYVPAAALPLAILFALHAIEADAWLPALTALAVVYLAAGLAIRAKAGWSFMLRNSALILGAAIAFAGLLALKETGGWYTLVIGLFFLVEMYLRKNGWFEVGAPVFFTAGAFLILRDFNVERPAFHLLTYSLLWFLADLGAHLTFTNPRPLSWVVRITGGLLTLANYGFLFFDENAGTGALGFAVYALLFLTVSLIYRQPALLYTFTLTFPLSVILLFRVFGVTKWIHPVMAVAIFYYAAGFLLRLIKRAGGWDKPLLYSGLGVGVVVSLASPILGGLDASLPVAAAATLWAVEAFAKRNAWLAFPANGLYLLAYFIILSELNVNEPQFFSMGAALLGLIQHYLLVRAQSRTGAFLMGMFSQCVLLGTTYIEMVVKSDLLYFFTLFLQSLVVLIYGLIFRSRSLTFFPIGFVVLGVVTVVYSALEGIGTIFLIGCTGILLLIVGVIAVLLRERIAKLGERLGDWLP